jgi:hypothetical protein
MRIRFLFLPIVVIALFAAFGWEVNAEAASKPAPAVTPKALEYPGADNVSVVNQQCLSDGTVQVTVNWQSYNLGPQWIDLSLYNNGFAQGTFIGLGPLSPYSNSQPWGGLLPGNWHYLRVNTLTQYGWYPSQTVSFFTRNDCYYQPPTVIDSDGDGVPDYRDTCPYQYGPAYNNGCPVSTPPPPNNGGAMCGGSWCPGQPAPAQFCGVQPLVVQARGCVWVTKGEGATYSIGEPITVCYWVSQPMYVQVTNKTPNGTNIIVNGNDDGRGNCVTSTVGSPAGQRTTTLYTLNSQMLDSVTWNAQ